MTSCALAVGLVAAARAQTVLVDFGSDTSYRGLSVINPDTNGNYWNSLQPGVLVENLVDIANAATTIDVGWDTPVGTDSYNGPAGPTGPADVKADLRNNDLPFTDIDSEALGLLGGALDAAFDFAAGPSLTDNRVRFQIQGLDPSKTYDLSFFGSHIFSLNTNTVYSVYTDNTYTTQVASVSLAVQDSAMPWLHNRDQIAEISGLSPQTDNILYVQFVGDAGAEGYLNDLLIEASESAGITSDYNGDLKVDAADYTVWRDNLGSTSTLPNDPVGGTIGTTQYENWKTNFGMMAGRGLGSVSAVPEPRTFLLCLLASVGALCLRSHR